MYYVSINHRQYKMRRGYLSIKIQFPHFKYGESNSIGRVPHCDCGCCGIVPRLLPHYAKRNRRLTLDRQNYDYRSEYRWGFGRAIGAWYKETKFLIVGLTGSCSYGWRLLVVFIVLRRWQLSVGGEMIYLSSVLTPIRQCYDVIALQIR